MEGLPRGTEKPRDFPLLGEPFAVELANTYYDAGGGTVDYLAERRSASTWLSLVAPAIGDGGPVRLAAEQMRGLSLARDATRQLLMDLADGAVPSDSARRVLQQTASLAPMRLTLSADEGRLAWGLRPDHLSRDEIVVDVSIRCILFLGGTEAPRVRRCATPDCPMLFAQRHRSRRFCHPSCAHGTRQARYYRSIKRSRHED